MSQDTSENSTTVTVQGHQSATQSRVTRWVLGPKESIENEKNFTHKGSRWWNVMCLTGVDYFSTLGYQPAIAAVAAGLLSPMATIVLVLLTLFGALPVYRMVATKSYRGEGSIAIMEHMLPWWTGKLFVLVMLGFAATDFIITITLSAADASAHIIQNPFATGLQGDELILTLGLIAILGIVFILGFREAIGIAVVLVVVYLSLNLIVMVEGMVKVFQSPIVITNWWDALLTQHGNVAMMIAVSLLVFPKLALGMSGFETGAAVMPQIRGERDEPGLVPVIRIAGTKKLLTTAAVIMSAFLIVSSFITTLLIPQDLFQPGGEANGRALAYLAHQFFGEGFGTVYDISTILILWFAGASAMAGLLNLVPRYLPRYGMAPQWAALSRPLVIVFTCIAFAITVFFNASVDAQAGAYATGVLVLMTSAALAASLIAHRAKKTLQTVLFSIITAVFVYTTGANIVERPDGVRIASIFIAAIIVVSLLSRVRRSFQLRTKQVTFDDRAIEFLNADSDSMGQVTLVAHESHGGDQEEYRAKTRDERSFNNLPSGRPLLFVEVKLADSSEFMEEILVKGCTKYGNRILTLESNSVPNGLAAVLLAIREEFGVVPEIYFDWSEGNPLSNMLRFLITGGGEIAPVTREVLRQAEPDVRRRPRLHVS